MSEGIMLDCEKGAVNQVLDRTTLSQNADSIREVIEFEVDYGTHVFKRLAGKSDCTKSGVANLIYRHILDLHDAVSILLGRDSDDPALVLIRAQFEAMLALFHVITDTSDKYARSYMFDKLLDELSACEEVINSVERESVPDSNSVDFVVYRVHKQYYEQAKADKDKLLVRMADDFYSDVSAARSKLKSKYPNWFSLFDGPDRIRGLAEVHGQIVAYDSLYGSFSRYAHGKSAMNFIDKVDGHGVIKSLRSGRSSAEMAINAHTYFCKATELVIENLLPDQLQQFYAWRLRCTQKSAWLLSLNKSTDA